MIQNERVLSMIYKIIDSNNNIIGYSENILYIKLNNSGCKVQCSSNEAQGIMFNNNIYSLSKNSIIENTEVVQIKESNLSEILNMIKQHQAIIDYILMQTGITIPEYLN